MYFGWFDVIYFWDVMWSYYVSYCMDFNLCFVEIGICFRFKVDWCLILFVKCFM